MAAQGLTPKLASASLILQILLAATKAINVTAANQPNQFNQPDPAVWNVTTSVQDYINQIQLQCTSHILDYERQIAAYKTYYDGQADTLTIQSTLIEKKLQETNEKLYPLEYLSLLTKHCVQSYRWKLPASGTIKTTVNSCITSAKTTLANYITTPANTMTTLNNYYNNQLKTLLNDCEKRYNATSYNLTICVTDIIDAANIYNINNRKTFSTQLQAAEFNGIARINTAGECAFNQVYAASSIIGVTLRLIDNCINNFLSTDEEPENSTSIETACPIVLPLKLEDAAFSNTTIKNPFYGFSSQIQCVQVNFV